MPITYGDNEPWPPLAGRQYTALYDEYHAWYVGDPTDLVRRYGEATYDTLRVRPSQRADGIYGWLARAFWGQPSVGGAVDMTRMHIPAAANISALSADLLYTERPKITIVDGTTDQTDRLQEILEDGGTYATLATAAEYASAYGSAYIRTTVDRDLADYPISEAIPPHCAIPQWRSGMLAAVTFWRTLESGDNRVLRLLEHHEPGSVQHQLRSGTAEVLGKVAPLDSHGETRRLAGLAGDDLGVIATGIERLGVVHQANIRPWREHPHHPGGRSDYAGSIDAMQSLDETWSLWMDALRLARPRLIVPDSYLRGLGAGRGATFDAAQRIFTAVKALDPQQKMQIEAVQFSVDVDLYDRTAAGNWRTIVRNAGLSADAFGEESSGAQATATEIGQRGARTIATRARKADQAGPAARRLAEILSDYDARYYSGQGSVAGARVRVRFSDGVTPDPKKDAETISLLDAAGALSQATKIAMAHPDWDDKQISAEIAKIEAEKPEPPSPPTDPGVFEGDPVEQPPVPDAVPGE